MMGAKEILFREVRGKLTGLMVGLWKRECFRIKLEED